MTAATIWVVPIGEDRFSLVLSDPDAAPSLGPSVGVDPQGYTDDDVRRELRDQHGLSSADITALMTAASSKRSDGG